MGNLAIDLLPIDQDVNLKKVRSSHVPGKAHCFRDGIVRAQVDADLLAPLAFEHHQHACLMLIEASSQFKLRYCFGIYPVKDLAQNAQTMFCLFWREDPFDQIWVPYECFD